MNTLKYLFVILILFLYACAPKYVRDYKKIIIEKPTGQKEKDQNAILDYLIDRKLDFQSTASGIYYNIQQEGLGENPNENSIVIMNYKGYTLDGNVFDSSYDRDEPLEISLANVITGWTEAGQLLKKATKGTFIIPSHLAYGKKGAGKDIAPNSVLIFEMELLDFYKPEDKEKRRIAKEQEAILSYLKEHNLNGQKTDSGIHYVIEKKGTGNHPGAKDLVKVHYHGKKLDGTTFDSSIERGEPIEFELSKVIKGWQEGIPLFKKGGKGLLIIPSHLAYGPKPRPGGQIKPNEVLVFDIELLDIIAEKEKIARQEGKFREQLDKFITPAKQKMGTKDDEILQAYIKKNQLKVQKTEDGIYYIVEKEGSQEKPNITSTVTVHYVGKLLNGNTFDSSVERGQPISLSLSRVVPGWTLGIPLFGKGGKGTLLIPSHLAYGERGAGNGEIPPNSCLIFDIEVFDFK